MGQFTGDMVVTAATLHNGAILTIVGGIGTIMLMGGRGEDHATL